VVPGVARGVQEAERPASELEREAVRCLDEAGRVDRHGGPVAPADELLAEDGRGPGPQLRRIDHVPRPAGVHDETGARQPPHDLARSPGVVEVHVGHDHVVHGLGAESSRLERGDQGGRRERRAHVHEGRAAVLDDEVARVEEGPREAGVDRGDAVAEVF
jgi:hypothetical protein